MISDAQGKHLELIQRVVDRLAEDSFSLKNWCITISLAGFGLFVQSQNKQYLFLIDAAALFFWAMDGYYLRKEKLFRKLYFECAHSYAIAKKKKVEVFSMDVESYKEKIPGMLRVMMSFPTAALYVGIFLVSLFFSFV